MALSGGATSAFALAVAVTGAVLGAGAVAACTQAGAETAEPAGGDGGAHTASGDDASVEVDAAAGATSPPRDCVADTMPDGLPRHLDCTGLYASLATKAIAGDVHPYRPAAEFWSDGSDKARFVHLPNGATIDNTDQDDWVFPVGTKLWKEFRLEGKRLETRLFAKTAEATWRATTYRWNDAESDATRLDRGETVLRATGPAYEIPRSSECSSCHKGRAEPVLGFEPVSLGLPGATGLTLARLAAEGRLAKPALATSFTIPEDATGKAASAVAWLHANCGSCHNASPTAEAFFSEVFFLIRPTQLGQAGVASASGLDVVKPTCGIPSSKVDPVTGAAMDRLAPGSPETSAVVVLSANRTAPGGIPNANEQMPPLVSHTVDTQGLGLVRDWIASMTSCPKR